MMRLGKVIALMILAITTVSGAHATYDHINTSSRAVQVSDQARDEESLFQITYDKNETIKKNLKGVVLLNADYELPHLESKKFPSAAEKINQYYANVRKQFNQSVETIFDEAKQDYKEREQDGKANWHPYITSIKYSPKLIDDQVISFVNDGFDDRSGAHPASSKFADNFKSSTGEHLLLKDVTKNEAEARKYVSDYIIKLIKSQDEWQPSADYEADVPSILTDETWYLSDEGFVAICNEYIIGPHALGVLEFVIPYKDATFLKEEYRK